MITVTVRTALSVLGNDKNDTDSFTGNVFTSGSNYVSPSILITNSGWTTLPSGSNADFLVGSFINQDSGSSIYIAVGATTNTASILTPNSPACMLSYSGSVNVYAKAVGANTPVALSYKLVSYN